MARSKENLYIVLNTQFNPPRDFSDKTIKYGLPQKTNLHDRNTTVRISGVAGRGYYGDVDVYYNRLDISDVVPLFEFRSQKELNRENVVTGLRNKHEIDIEPVDFDPFTLPPLEDGEVLERLFQVSANSLQWTGKLNAVLEFGPSWLDTVIKNTDLTVQRHPNDLPTRIYGRMLGWDVDFTGVLDMLKPVNGRYPNFLDVRKMTSALGWPLFGDYAIQDLPVSQVPLANPAFDRVIVQTTTNSSRISGPIYFHYNVI